MRVKTDEKRDAIFNASIKLINELGLAGASMSKIAKEAGISAATIYIYFDNKDALLENLYLMIKKQMSEELIQHIDMKAESKKSMQQFYFNTFQYFVDHPDHLALMEQFDHSPQLHKACKEKASEYFQPILSMIERGIESGVIRSIPESLLANMFFYPIMRLAKQHINDEINATTEVLELAFDMSWKAIKT